MVSITIFQSSDTTLTDKMATSLPFMATMVGIEVEVNLVSEPTFSSGDVILLHLNNTNLSKFQSNKALQTTLKNHQGVVITIFDEQTFDQQIECLNNSEVYMYRANAELTLENEAGDNESNIDILAHDIVSFIKSINQKQRGEFSVFLGPPDAEVSAVFQGIHHECIHRNFSIAPTIINPSGAEIINNKELLWQYLDKCQLAIHFISHQMLESNTKKMAPAMQINHLVAEYCNEKTDCRLKRIIYITPEDVNTTPDTARRIAEFKNDSFNLKNAELVQVPLERLKNVLINRYVEWLEPEKKVDDHIEKKSLYFIYPPRKENLVGDICKWFEDNKIDYAKSQVDLDQLKLLRYHEFMMVNANGLIIYNDGNEQWLRRKISDVIKSPGWGRNSYFNYIIICGKKMSETCKNIVTHECDIIDLTGDIDYNKLKKIISD